MLRFFLLRFFCVVGLLFTLNACVTSRNIAFECSDSARRQIIPSFESCSIGCDCGYGSQYSIICSGDEEANCFDKCTNYKCKRRKPNVLIDNIMSIRH